MQINWVMEALVADGLGKRSYVIAMQLNWSWDVCWEVMSMSVTSATTQPV